jgi:MFS family permease
MIAGIGDGLPRSYPWASFLLMLPATLPRRCYNMVRLMPECRCQFAVLPLYAGTIGGGALSALIAREHGWRNSFFFFGVAGVLLMVLLAIALRPSPQSRGDDKRNGTDFVSGMRNVMANGCVLTLICVFIGANFVSGGFPYVVAYVSVHEVPSESGECGIQ